MKRKIAIVTGANSGMGKAKLKLMHCDLASLSQISVFCERIHEKYDVIDCIVNNAGVITLRRQETDDGFEKQFGVNHLGHVYMIHHLMDLLLKSKEARIIVGN